MLITKRRERSRVEGNRLTAQQFPNQGEMGMQTMLHQGMHYPFSQYYTSVTFLKEPYKNKYKSPYKTYHLNTLDT